MRRLLVDRQEREVYIGELGRFSADHPAAEVGSGNALTDDFLERLGCRWFFPGAFGEVVPKRDTIEIADMDVREKAGFAKLVEMARRFQSTVTLSKDHDAVDGKSILGILMLAAACGETVELQAQGTDENEAAEAIRDLFQRRFDEDE